MTVLGIQSVTIIEAALLTFSLKWEEISGQQYRNIHGYRHPVWHVQGIIQCI